MSKREWLLALALGLMLAVVLWQGRAMEKSLDRLQVQLDAREQARIDMLEARVISLERKTAKLEAKAEED